MEKKEVIAKLIANGGIQINDLKVKNVNVTPQEKYVRIALTLDKPVMGMVSDDNGATYHEGETNVIFVSLYSVTSILKDNENVAFAVNHFNENPKSMSVVLSRAKINIIAERVVSGQEYRNPWSDSDNVTIFDHDTIIYHIIDVTLSDFALRNIEKIAIALLGI